MVICDSYGTAEQITNAVFEQTAPAVVYSSVGDELTKSINAVNVTVLH